MWLEVKSSIHFMIEKENRLKPNIFVCTKASTSQYLNCDFTPCEEKWAFISTTLSKTHKFQPRKIQTGNERY